MYGDGRSKKPGAKGAGSYGLYVKHRSWVGMEISEIPLRAVATFTKIADTIETVSYIKLR
jgi:hypothetical protein